MILGVIFTRRLMAAVGIHEEELGFMDSRFVPSRAAEVGRVSSSYLRRVLEQSRPEAVYLCLSKRAGAISETLSRMLDAEAGTLGIPVKHLGRAEVASSFGLLPLRTRKETVEITTRFWPSLREAKETRRALLSEAAAVAAVGDIRQGWPLP